MQLSAHPLLAAAALMLVASCGQVAPPASEAPPKPAMPALAEWIKPLAGQPFSAIVPTLTSDCIGVVDGLNTAYADGAKVIGWAWNTKANAAYAQFLAVDKAGIIRGGGGGGLDRPDVTAALPDKVTGIASGFAVETSLASGTLLVFGYDAAAKTACQIGEKTY